MRHDAVEKAAAIVNRGDDPLSVVSGWVMDVKQDPEFRLRAAACVLPYLYPRLSASQVDARVTNVKVDSADLLRRLDERLARMVQPATIEAHAAEPPLTIEIFGDDEADTNAR